MAKAWSKSQCEKATAEELEAARPALAAAADEPGLTLDQKGYAWGKVSRIDAELRRRGLASAARTPLAQARLSDIAERIAAHLRRLERDPVACKPQEHRGMRLLPYWHAGARRSGRRVLVTYVSYQGATPLTRDEALAYLAWLDAGNAGTHYAQQRAAAAK